MQEAERRIHGDTESHDRREIRGKSGVDKERLDKSDTDTDAELLKKYGIDPQELKDEFGGQSPVAG